MSKLLRKKIWNFAVWCIVFSFLGSSHLVGIERASLSDPSYLSYDEYKSLEGEITEYGNYGVTNPWDVKINDLPDSSSSKLNQSKIPLLLKVSHSLILLSGYIDIKTFTKLLAIHSEILKWTLYPFHCFF